MIIIKKDVIFISKQPNKVIIFGLDKAGKTSIVQCLQRKTKISNFTSPIPTRDFEISVFLDPTTKQEFAVWDFGGQEQYRNDHLDKLLSDYIYGATKLIYVIDIQDPERFDLALKYFEQIIKRLEENESKIKMSIFLHKYDDDINIDKGKIEELIRNIKNNIPKEIMYDISKSSISAVFRKSTLF
ncbi:MAG: ADP-ribosylation factor-like protein [Promethearchaeota archaeon]